MLRRLNDAICPVKRKKASPAGRGCLSADVEAIQAVTDPADHT